VTRDRIIQINSTHARKCGASCLRRVGDRDTESGKHCVFVTNHFGLSAKVIAAIYNDRWQVELFFKAIKQNLKIKAFVRTACNTVLTRIWIALLTYLLLAFAGYSSQAEWTVQWVMRVLQLSLFEPGSLEDIVKPDPERHNKTSLK
jgi:IS4 transposase